MYAQSWKTFDMKNMFLFLSSIGGGEIPNESLKPKKEKKKENHSCSYITYDNVNI